MSNVDLVEFADAGAMWASLAAEGSAASPWQGLVSGWVKFAGLGVAVAMMLIAALGVMKRRQGEMRRMRAMDLG